MKKMVQKEISFCDICNTDNNVFYTCDICGKQVCYEHKDEIVQFSQSTCCSGGDDGAYCHACLKKNPNDPLILAYRVVQDLRDETKKWYADFEVRAKTAEEHIKNLRNSSTKS